MNPLLLDYLPLLAFFGGYMLGGIYVGTAAGMAASTAAVAYTLIRRQPVRVMTWISFGLIVVFGGATLLFKNDIFIRVKPTVLYWLFALTLGLGPPLAGRNFIRNLLERELRLPDAVWVRLNNSWAAFFGLLGGLNLAIAFRFSQSTWVTFKVFGTIGLTLVFVVAQVLLLQRYLQGQDKP